jgi:hypothetical protein
MATYTGTITDFGQFMNLFHDLRANPGNWRVEGLGDDCRVETTEVEQTALDALMAGQNSLSLTVSATTITQAPDETATGSPYETVITCPALGLNFSFIAQSPNGSRVSGDVTDGSLELISVDIGVVKVLIYSGDESGYAEIEVTA